MSGAAEVKKWLGQPDPTGLGSIILLGPLIRSRMNEDSWKDFQM